MIICGLKVRRGVEGERRGYKHALKEEIFYKFSKLGSLATVSVLKMQLFYVCG